MKKDRFSGLYRKAVFLFLLSLCYVLFFQRAPSLIRSAGRVCLLRRRGPTTVFTVTSASIHCTCDLDRFLKGIGKSPVSSPILASCAYLKVVCVLICHFRFSFDFFMISVFRFRGTGQRYHQRGKAPDRRSMTTRRIRQLSAW